MVCLSVVTRLAYWLLTECRKKLKLWVILEANCVGYCAGFCNFAPNKIFIPHSLSKQTLNSSSPVMVNLLLDFTSALFMLQPELSKLFLTV